MRYTHRVSRFGNFSQLSGLESDIRKAVPIQRIGAMERVAKSWLLKTEKKPKIEMRCVYMVIVITFLSSLAFSEYDPSYLQCFVYKQAQAIMINIPKNGSTSIRNSLEERAEILSYFDLPEQIRNSWKKFIIVRHPMKRVVSSYLEERLLRLDRVYKDVINEPFIIYRSDLEESFRLYVSYLERGFKDQHAFPQHLFLKAKNLSLHDMDVILDLDDLSKDFKHLTKVIGFEAEKVKQVNVKKESTKTSLRRLIEKSPGLRRRIYAIYEEDFAFYQAAIERKKELLSKF